MIPKKFELMGATWMVKKVDHLKDSQGNPIHGYTHTDKRLIEIDAEAFDDKDLLSHTWFHELNHAIWATLGFDFWGDEDKVDLDAGLRSQVEKTKKGELF